MLRDLLSRTSPDELALLREELAQAKAWGAAQRNMLDAKAKESENYNAICKVLLAQDEKIRNLIAPLFAVDPETVNALELVAALITAFAKERENGPHLSLVQEPIPE